MMSFQWQCSGCKQLFVSEKNVKLRVNVHLSRIQRRCPSSLRLSHGRNTAGRPSVAGGGRRHAGDSDLESDHGDGGAADEDDADWQDNDQEADCPDEENEEPGKKYCVQCTLMLFILYVIVSNIVLYCL